MNLISKDELIKKNFAKIKISENERIAIYGTGKGARIVYELIKESGYLKNIKLFIENSDTIIDKSQIENIPISDIESSVEHIDTIFIGAAVNYKVIVERLNLFFKQNDIDNIIVHNIFSVESQTDNKDGYINYIEKIARRDYADSFVAPRDKEIKLTENDPKVIAWYLPQFHRIDVNDKFYGRGFTEWTNTSQTLPMYEGHYQPHIPYDVGYYDLENLDVMKRQVELAHFYGVYGFSFYYYWFSGKRIMEKPVDMYLNHGELDLPFCITWANENWSALWDGGNKELIYEQTLKEGDDERFINDILPLLRDSRYIRINDRPVLIVYRANIWEKSTTKQLFDNFRKIVRKNGIEDLYIIVTNAGKFEEDVYEYGADALVEFPPHNILQLMDLVYPSGYINPNFVGSIYSARNFLKEKRYLYNHISKVFYRGAMPSWDNTARKMNTGASIFDGIDPSGFCDWLCDIIHEGKVRNKDNNYIFINGWNEWAEGNHIEPDMRYGYGNLCAIADAIEKSRMNR